MKEYGIWYDDGRTQFGWLSIFGGNGREYRYEAIEEEATHFASVMRQEDPATAYLVQCVDADKIQIHREGRRAGLTLRLQRAETELAAVKAAFDTLAEYGTERG